MNNLEQKIYEAIKAHNGILAKDISLITGIEKRTVSSLLYHSNELKSRCYMDENWFHYTRDSNSIASPSFRHSGLAQHSCYYGSVADFVQLNVDDWIIMMNEGCIRAKKGGIGTAQIKAWADCFEVMQGAFSAYFNMEAWDIAFEYNSTYEGVNRWVDVLLIIDNKIIVIEFKMVRCFFEKYLDQTEKYIPDLERYFIKEDVEIVPLLVLTQAVNLRESYPYRNLDYALEVCSGDILSNVIESILSF